jgi:apolipoprotein N-acyltransferase
VLVLCCSWGAWRISRYGDGTGHTARFSCIQANLDQLHWSSGSLDTSFAVIESLTYRAAQDSPRCIVMAESALLCYLDRQLRRRNRVLGWHDSLGVPMIIGALDWKRGPENSPYRFLVYNTAFFLGSGSRTLQPYYKMKLVPFSEAIPFEADFPVLSRVNLGESDFKAGSTPVVFTVDTALRVVPLICYEVIFPAFVRSRLDTAADVIVNITNDGWFRRSSGPFHHGAMARMRCIENGTSLVRCANSGISMMVDPVGRVIARKGLYRRGVLTAEVPLERLGTVYDRLGDWPVGISGLVLVLAAVTVLWRWSAGRRARGGRRG